MVNDNTYHLATEFAVSVKEGQDKLSTLYWLPKLHKRPFRARFIYLFIYLFCVCVWGGGGGRDGGGGGGVGNGDVGLN